MPALELIFTALIIIIGVLITVRASRFVSRRRFEFVLACSATVVFSVLTGYYHDRPEAKITFALVIVAASAAYLIKGSEPIEKP